MRALSPTWSLVAAILPALLLSACGGGSTGQQVRTTKPVATKPVKRPAASVASPVRRPAPPVGPLPARVQNLPGLEGVIGAGVARLTREFGTPRLDVWEGDARKLQFVGTPCVLDIFLYPPAAGREPQATYVEARRPSDGKDVDRAACIAGLRKD